MGVRAWRPALNNCTMISGADRSEATASCVSDWVRKTTEASEKITSPYTPTTATFFRQRRRSDPAT